MYGRGNFLPVGGEASQEGILMPFACQIAGHGSAADDGHRAFLKHADSGRLLKPLQAPPKGAREAGFYEAIKHSDDPTDAEIRQWIPRYFGVDKFSVGGAPETEYIVLEDLTEKCERPNVMDIKIGSRTYGPDALEKKRNHEDAKYPGTKKPLGFSVLGIIVNPRDGGDSVKYDRSFGRNLRTEDAADAGKIFFESSAAGGIVRPLVEAVLVRLRQLLELYRRQRKYLTYASSVLFVYDGAAVSRFLASDGGSGDQKALEKSVTVNLIDFAHVFPNEDKVEDINFTRGLENLIKTFESLLDDEGSSREPSPKK